METNNLKPKRLTYIECGTTARSQVNTGIQRVVRNITNEAVSLGERYMLEIKLVTFENYGFNFVTSGSSSKVVSDDNKLSGLKNTLKIVAIKISRLASRMLPRELCEYLRKRLRHHDKNLRASRGGNIVELTAIGQDGTPSILLLLDSTWDDAIWPYVDDFRARGGRVYAVLYDLIPFTHPDTVDESTRIAHTNWWSNAPEHIDAVMCISQTVREDFLFWQKKRFIKKPLLPESVGYFYLGSELSSSDPVVRLLTDGEPFFLVVGSLEPRKCHETILNAFELLWEKGMQTRLAIVGAYGWKSEALLERIQKHDLLNKQLFLIRDASDRDLVALYGITSGVIFASLAEGFGLPIVEACKQGASVICSDIPVFREVAGEKARYFKILNSISLAEQVLAQLHFNENTRPKQPSLSQAWINWNESAEQLLKKVSEFR